MLDQAEPPSFPAVSPGDIPPDPVAPDSLHGIPRQRTNPARWGGQGWDAFAGALRKKGLDVRQTVAARAIYVTDS